MIRFIKSRSVALATILLLCISWQVAAAAELEPGAPLLGVSIAKFDPGIPADASLHRDLQVYPRIRRIEALFLPFLLREKMAASGEWGAVRVVPEPDGAAELLVTGKIVRSDGETLELLIQVVDASGRAWLEKTYAAVTTASDVDNGTGPGLSGYQLLYADIAEDIRLERGRLDNKSLSDIVEISTLRYANELAPDAFGEHLSESPDGIFTIRRLPAEDDPMLARIERIRSVEYVMTDAVDEEFKELHAEIASIYDLWREYRRKFSQYQIEEAKRVANARSTAPHGSYEEMKRNYDNYKWDRLAQQEQEKWAVGFNNEVGPTVMEMESRVAELEGWVDQEYSTWRRILAEYFELETGLRE